MIRNFFDKIKRVLFIRYNNKRVLRYLNIYYNYN